MLTVSHSHKCNEIWMQYSIYVGTEFCFSYGLRQRRFGALGLRLSPKRNTYCTQFTEEILSFSLRIPAPTVGNVGIRPVQYSDFKVPARTWPVLYVTEVFSSELPLFKYAPNFHSVSFSLSLSLSISLSISILFPREIVSKINLNLKQCFHPFDQQMSLPYADDSSPILTLTSPCPSVLHSIY